MNRTTTQEATMADHTDIHPAAHQDLSPYQFQVENTETLRVAAPVEKRWLFRLVFTYAGAGGDVYGEGTDEQSAVADALRHVADAVCEISTEGRSE